MDEISSESIRFDRSKTNRVGLGGLLFHDHQRSAVRNMERAGISREVAKKISGRKTDSAHRRYNIVDNRDIENAGKKLAEFLKGQA